MVRIGCGNVTSVMRGEGSLALASYCPYDILKHAAKSMLDEEVDGEGDEDIEIAEGGAAAFSRLQYESLDDKTRSEIKTALLRYSELDTLAMVMIVEAWRAEL